MKFSVNVDALYMDKGIDIHDGVEEMAKAGVKAIEFWGWWDKDLQRLCDLKEKYGLEYVGICPKLTSMVDPEYKEIYLADFADVVEAAKKIDCTALFVKPGDKTGEDYGVQYQRMKELLLQMIKMVEGTDITILLEPVSFMEAPHTFLGLSDAAFKMIKEINHPQLRVLYDLYHMQLDEGDVTRRVINHLSDIGHLHVAGGMDRHELPDGEIDYGYVFEKLEKAGYDKYVGLEYFPVEDPVEGVKKVIFEHKYR